MKHLEREREREGSGVDDKGRKDESKRQKTKTKLDVGAEIVAKPTLITVISVLEAAA